MIVNIRYVAIFAIVLIGGLSMSNNTDSCLTLGNTSLIATSYSPSVQEYNIYENIDCNGGLLENPSSANSDDIRFYYARNKKALRIANLHSNVLENSFLNKDTIQVEYYIDTSNKTDLLHSEILAVIRLANELSNSHYANYHYSLGNITYLKNTTPLALLAACYSDDCLTDSSRNIFMKQAGIEITELDNACITIFCFANPSFEYPQTASSSFIAQADYQRQIILGTKSILFNTRLLLHEFYHLRPYKLNNRDSIYCDNSIYNFMFHTQSLCALQLQVDQVMTMAADESRSFQNQDPSIRIPLLSSCPSIKPEGNPCEHFPDYLVSYHNHRDPGVPKERLEKFNDIDFQKYEKLARAYLKNIKFKTKEDQQLYQSERYIDNHIKSTKLLIEENLNNIIIQRMLKQTPEIVNKKVYKDHDLQALRKEYFTNTTYK